MVTKREQMSELVSPKQALAIALAFIVMGIVAFAMAKNPETTRTTATYTQDAGNQPGAKNNSLNSGPMTPLSNANDAGTSNPLHTQ